MEFFTTGCKYLNVFLLHFSLLFLMLKTLKINHIFTDIWNRDYEIYDSHFGPNICICKLHDGRRRQIVPIFPHSELVQGRFTGTPSSSYGERILSESFLGRLTLSPRCVSILIHLLIDGVGDSPHQAPAPLLR